MDNVADNIKMNQESVDICPVDFSDFLLCDAVQTCNLPELQSLVDDGADVPHRFENDATPLFLACGVKKNSYPLCKYLLEKGADRNSRTAAGTTPLHRALKDQPFEVVQLLLDHGADINAADGSGLTALHYAASNSRVEVLEFVLRLNASGRSALFYAARHASQQAPPKAWCDD